jgi:nucleotide-binding universal stress UspA family protein
MTRITNILVPVDFSRASERAMYYATHLASKFDAKLIAAHIVPALAVMNYAFPDDPVEFETNALAEAKRLLPKEIPAGYRDRLRTETVVKCGDVRDELLGIAADYNVDLVVMGRHGRRSIERFILGSVTENILRRVTAPILTVSARGEEQPAESPFDVPFRRILYATDLSEEGVSGGLHYAVDLARTLGAHLTLVNVIEPAFESESESRARRLGELQEAIEREQGEDLGLTTQVLRGFPHHEIPKCAKETNADLIVINLQSKSLLERALLGATAERVIRSARIPVLSIPAPVAETPIPARLAEVSIC